MGCSDVPDRRLPSRSAHPPRTVPGRRPESDPHPRALPHGARGGEVGPAAGRGLREGLPPDVRRVPRPRRGSLPRRVEQPLRAPGRAACARAAAPRAPSRAPLRPLLAAVAIAVASPVRPPGSSGRTGRPSTRRRPRRRRPRRSRRSAKPPAAAPPAAPAYAVFRAARGSCWLLVRSSGAAGPGALRADARAGEHAPAAGRPRPLGAHRRAVEPRPQRRRHAPSRGLPTAPANVLVSKSGVAAA